MKWKMAELVACSVVKYSEDVIFAGGVILVEGQKEGQAFRFYTDLYKYCNYTAYLSTNQYTRDYR